MAYPALKQVIGSKPVDEGGTVIERAPSGRPRAYSYYSKTWRLFDVLHELYEADKITLMAYYETNKFKSFDFVWSGNGLTYVCMFGGSPQLIPVPGERRWQVSVRLLVVT